MDNEDILKIYNELKTVDVERIQWIFPSYSNVKHQLNKDLITCYFKSIAKAFLESKYSYAKAKYFYNKDFDKDNRYFGEENCLTFKIDSSLQSEKLLKDPFICGDKKIEYEWLLSYYLNHALLRCYSLLDISSGFLNVILKAYKQRNLSNNKRAKRIYLYTIKNYLDNNISNVNLTGVCEFYTSINKISDNYYKDGTFSKSLYNNLKHNLEFFSEGIVLRDDKLEFTRVTSGELIKLLESLYDDVVEYFNELIALVSKNMSNFVPQQPIIVGTPSNEQLEMLAKVECTNVDLEILDYLTIDFQGMFNK